MKKLVAIALAIAAAMVATILATSYAHAADTPSDPDGTRVTSEDSGDMRDMMMR